MGGYVGKNDRFDGIIGAVFCRFAKKGRFFRGFVYGFFLKS